MGGHQVAGRDMFIQEGFKLRTQMRASVKNAIRIGCLSFLAGFALLGYFVITWNSKISMAGHYTHCSAGGIEKQAA